jgi:hypothetical protein
MHVDSDSAAKSCVKEKINHPQRGGVTVAHTGSPSAVKGVAFAYAVWSAQLLRTRIECFEVSTQLGIGADQ